MSATLWAIRRQVQRDKECGGCQGHYSHTRALALAEQVAEETREHVEHNTRIHMVHRGLAFSVVTFLLGFWLGGWLL